MLGGAEAAGGAFYDNADGACAHVLFPDRSCRQPGRGEIPVTAAARAVSVKLLNLECSGFSMDKNTLRMALLLSAAVGFVGLSRFAAANPSTCDAIAGNLIVNCGFETGTLAGWTQSGNTNFTFVAGPGSLNPPLDNPNSGDRLAALGPVGSDGFLSQTFTDTPGELLRVEFFMADDGHTPNDFHAAFDDNMLLSLSNDGTHRFIDYVFVVAGTGLDTLTIGGYRNDTGFFGLDDVSVAPVPEPGSVGLLAIFFAGLGIRLGRRTGRSMLPVLA